MLLRLTASASPGGYLTHSEMICRTGKCEKHWLRELTLKEEKIGPKIERELKSTGPPVTEQGDTEEL